MENQARKERIALGVKVHWENKFAKSVQILLKSGVRVEELMERIKLLASQYDKEN